MEELSTQVKGDIAEFRVICALMIKGCKVFKSCTQNCRYDLVFEYENKFYKVQVKSAKYNSEKGSIHIPTRSIKLITNETRSYKGEVDYFGIYCPQLDKCYLVPEKHLSSSGLAIYLRVDDSKNNQAIGIHLAKNYEL